VIYEIGAQAMNLLITCIEKKDVVKSKIILDAQLVIRESTGKAKIR